ncbi:hypothetical protein [Listeria ilorinensis]|uniref:hypothetical protein n=1 Tax=Listeria ilorinensis TaxID=2867439 RepID=UPI001EF4130F|nr:hypothetical protein [Listeria ilorinensis]
MRLTDKKILKLVCKEFECRRNEIYLIRETPHMCMVIHNDYGYYITISNRRPFKIVSCVGIEMTQEGSE